MILPMKKVSVLVVSKERERAMRRLRRLGLLHIDAQNFGGERATRLREQKEELEAAMQTVRELVEKEEDENKETKVIRLDEALTRNALRAADTILELADKRKACLDQQRAYQAELERLKKWGEVDPEDFRLLEERGLKLSLYELSQNDYQVLREAEDVKILVVSQDKAAVRVLLIEDCDQKAPAEFPAGAHKVLLPVMSTANLRRAIDESNVKAAKIAREITAYESSLEAMEKAAALTEREETFEAYLDGTEQALLSENLPKKVSLTMISGYIPAEDLDKLKDTARENAWGIAAEDPTEEDHVPTKLRNNKFVSLIYPLTDFLGTVPGYFEYDISGWFLAFMLIFFGIIFGDGGYGLLITGVAAALIFKAKSAKKEVPPVYLLLALLGGATILWGLLTCTWFGLKPDQLPVFLQKLSLPVISNVNESRIWHPFWISGDAGLTTAQNVQIFCFALALVQLSVAHILGMIRNRHSLKLLGELGSLMQLIGMFYVVLTLVVNGEVFGLDRVIAGIPVGTVAIVLVAVGFVLSFIFGSYEGSVKDSILDSLKNIISILLGVVNVFSDIVSYIRLWAVGLAGAAISATVNEMAGPMFGKLAFIVFAVILLVFGHGLNMILNVLSVIVHGVRLNTLEFSSHLGISWGGHKYDPFKE